MLSEEKYENIKFLKLLTKLKKNRLDLEDYNKILMNCIIFDTISSFSCVRTSRAISLSIDASTSTKTCKSSAEDSTSKLRKRDEDEGQRGLTRGCRALAARRILATGKPAPVRGELEQQDAALSMGCAECFSSRPHLPWQAP